MIRFKTNRMWKGKRVEPNQIVIGSRKEKLDLIDCNQAYDDGLEPDPTPDMSNTKQEIIDYLNAHYIEHKESDTKQELLDLI